MVLDNRSPEAAFDYLFNCGDEFSWGLFGRLFPSPGLLRAIGISSTKLTLHFSLERIVEFVA